MGNEGTSSNAFLVGVRGGDASHPRWRDTPGDSDEAALLIRAHREERVGRLEELAIDLLRAGQRDAAERLRAVRRYIIMACT